MYNLYTCGELNSITFTSDSISSTEELSDKPNTLLVLNNNSKKTRTNREKKGEFKIKSNARIIKLDLKGNNYLKTSKNPNDIKNIFEIKKDGTLGLTSRMAKVIYESKADGIYLSSDLAEKMKEFYPDQVDFFERSKNSVILKNNSVLVNKKDYVQEKVDRKLKIGKSAKDAFTLAHYNTNNLATMMWNNKKGYNFKRDKHGNVAQIIDKNNRDITNQVNKFIDVMEKDLNGLYEDLKNEYPELKNIKLEISKNLDPNGRDRFSPKDKTIYVYPITSVLQYFAMAKSDYVPFKKELTPNDVVRSMFYHEVGHAVNNDFFAYQQSMKQYVKEDKDNSGKYTIKAENLKKMYRCYHQQERNATDFALKKMDGNKAAFYNLASAYATYHQSKLVNTFSPQKGKIISIYGQEVEIV